MKHSNESRGRKWTRWGILLGFSIVLYASFLAPCGVGLNEGIPYTTYQTEVQDARVLVQGDQLQLLYHFQLVREMLCGRVPWLSNLYEFNLGDDAARRIIDPYYVPFSLIFAIISLFGGDALGWNGAQFCAVWLGLYLLFLLARRYRGSTGNDWGALFAAVVASCLPYRWTTLGAGSPTGFGIALIPAVALGIDLAIRERRTRGGVLAGAVLLLCYATDLHSFLFAALALPFWCLVSWISSRETVWPNGREIKALVASLWPLGIGAALAGGIALYLRAQYAVTDVAGGRTLDELRVHSPHAAGFFTVMPSHGTTLHVYLGFGLLLLLLVGVLVACWMMGRGVRTRRNAPEGLVAVTGQPLRNWVCAGLFACGVWGCILIAWGVNAPLEGLPIRILRKLVPPFQMVRQPVKIYCLLPTLLAPFFAILFSVVLHRWHSWKGLTTLGVLGVLCWVSSHAQMRVGSCILPREVNRAYAMAVERATASGRVARALILPIWPGDSSASSIYEYWAIRSGLRMVNGYSAVKTADYLEAVFHRFEHVTQGELTEDQLAALEHYGVTHLLLHENAFPEKVSPFPVGVTLKRLLAHPRLRYLTHDRGVWCFEILAEARVVSAREKTAAKNALFAPARVWYWGRLSDPSVNGKPAFEGVRPEAEANQSIQIGLWGPQGCAEDYAWRVYARASNAWVPLVEQRDGETILTLRRPERDTAATWRWLTLDVAQWQPKGRTHLTIRGDAEILAVQFISRGHAWVESNGKGEFVIPFVDLFHAGYSIYESEDGFKGVQFEPRWDMAAEIAYGPNLPLAARPGWYEVEVDGDWTCEGAESSQLIMLLNGQAINLQKTPGAMAFYYDGESVVSFRYAYAAKAPECLRSIRIRRRSDASCEREDD